MPPFELPSFTQEPSAGASNQGPVTPQEPLIADRAEFLDALARLLRDEVLVHSVEAGDQRCLIGGHVLYASWKPLIDFGLLVKLPPRPRQGRIDCYRLSPHGRSFAEQAWASWKQRPLWQRLAIRLVG